MSTKTKKKKNIFLGMGGVMPDHIQKNFLKYIFINCLEGGDTMSGSEKTF
jgi:hypothetical protein